MPNPSPEPVDEFEELRNLLLSGEREELRSLRKAVEDKEHRAQDVSDVLAQATRLCNESGEELSRALQPVIGESLMEAITKRPQLFIEAFHPIIGPLLRRAIAESLRGLMQSLNQRLDHVFSVQGMKWRVEAWRTGRSFAEVVLLRSLVYRVEQVFLIHRETSLLLLHVSADGSDGKDSDMVAGMLSAIQDFSRDSFHSGRDATLEEFRVGEMEVWIAPGREAYIAAVIRGTPPRELRAVFDDCIEQAHILKGREMAGFAGDASVFEPFRPDLEACLRTQYQDSTGANKSMAKVWGAIAVVAALIIVATFFAVRSAQRWEHFRLRLGAEPGIAVTDVRRHWFSASRVAGLRDPLAADPMVLARKSGLDPGRIQFQWKDFVALDATSVRRRVERRFGAPAGVRIAIAQGVTEIAGDVPYEWMERVLREGKQVPGVDSIGWKAVKVTYDPSLVLKRFSAAYPPPSGLAVEVADGTLHLSGTAPYEWMAAVREGAVRIPGISAIAEGDVKVTFDPSLVLRRFEDRFGLPESVTASVHDGVLALSGEASHAWLERVRKGATEIPGIVSLDDRQTLDSDETAFRRSKAVVENANVYFATARDEISVEGAAILSLLSDEIRRAQTAARRMGLRFSVEILGSADALGSEETNRELSERRALHVRSFLLSSGLDAGILKPAANPAAKGMEANANAEKSARRVTFRIVAGT
jgi:OOP family OmpA-OmpF porin